MNPIRIKGRVTNYWDYMNVPQVTGTMDMAEVELLDLEHKGIGNGDSLLVKMNGFMWRTAQANSTIKLEVVYIFPQEKSLEMPERFYKICVQGTLVCQYANTGHICNYIGYCDYQLPKDSRQLSIKPIKEKIENPIEN